MIKHNGQPRLAYQAEPPAVVIPPAWTEWAACRGVPDPDVFFPPAGTKSGDKRVRTVIEGYCEQCPVRAACAEFADRRGEVGIWGGRLRISQSTKWVA